MSSSSNLNPNNNANHLSEGMTALSISNANTLNAQAGQMQDHQLQVPGSAVRNPRKSFAPSMGAPQGGGMRKSSILGSKAMMANMANGMGSAMQPNMGQPPRVAGGGFVANSTVIPLKDTRPIRDKAYQNMMATAVYEYLFNNNFEMDMKHSITPKSLRSPTQKDFVMMFQWLYKRVDPGYKFTKSIDNEVIPLMKTIGYPFLDSVSKSQLVAVGGQNWGAYLAMLFWLMELAATFDAVDTKDYDVEESEDFGLNQIVINYITNSYSAFLQNEDDYSKFEAEMREAFEERIAAIKESCDDFVRQSESIEVEINQLETSMPSLDSLRKKTDVLESDLSKFQAYIENMEKRKEKWDATIESLEADLKLVEEEFGQLEKEKTTLDARIVSQGLTPADIDEIIGQREQLSKAIQGHESKLDKVRRELNERESTAQHDLQRLDNAVQKYTNLGFRTGILSTPRDPSVPQGIDFAVSIIPSPLADENLGKRPEGLIHNVDLRHVIRPALLQVRRTINSMVHRTEDESLRLQSALERTAEMLADRRDQLDTLEAQVSAAKITYDEAFEMMTSEVSSFHAENEKLERKIQTMRIGVQDGRLQLEQRSERAIIEYDDMQHAAKVIREQMRSRVSECIEKTVAFKLHVQTSLVDYENFIVDELEHQSQQSSDYT
ncbi:HEC/Ndc80p family-domain-containing protein [Dipodascopsis tothii]|uniref:HEC/Ndc80p family-domain-containing protein n=1 Tax=Dipodascopsis tothii TaxID=44089 RepID=UPI0034CF54AC